MCSIHFYKDYGVDIKFGFLFMVLKLLVRYQID